MNLDIIYNQVKAKIELLNFKQLWNNFLPIKFALYNENQCYFNGEYIEKTDAFCANTSIDFHGETIAIWRIFEQENNIDALTSCLVHEMFHGFQRNNNWDYFADEFEAVVNYKYVSENLSTKMVENDLLLKLENKFNQDDFNQVLALRNLRKIKFPYEFAYESKVEIIEGTANYVEWQVLKQLNLEAAERFLKIAKYNLNRPAYYLPIRISCYLAGALLINAVLKLNNVDDTTIFDMILNPQSISQVNNCLSDSSSAKEAIGQYFTNVQKKIEKAKEENQIVVNGTYKLKAFNCFDGAFLNSFLTSRYFINYIDNEISKFLYGDFVVELDANGKIKKIYKTEL